MILQCGNQYCKLKYETPDLELEEAIQCLNNHTAGHIAENVFLWLMREEGPTLKATKHSGKTSKKTKYKKRPIITPEITKQMAVCPTSPIDTGSQEIQMPPHPIISSVDPNSQYIHVKHALAVHQVQPSPQ